MSDNASSSGRASPPLHLDAPGLDSRWSWVVAQDSPAGALPHSPGSSLRILLVDTHVGVRLLAPETGCVDLQLDRSAIVGVQEDARPTGLFRLLVRGHGGGGGGAETTGLVFAAMGTEAAHDIVACLARVLARQPPPSWVSCQSNFQLLGPMSNSPPLSRGSGSSEADAAADAADNGGSPASSAARTPASSAASTDSSTSRFVSARLVARSAGITKRVAGITQSDILELNINAINTGGGGGDVGGGGGGGGGGGRGRGAVRVDHRWQFRDVVRVELGNQHGDAFTLHFRDGDTAHFAVARHQFDHCLALVLGRIKIAAAAEEAEEAEEVAEEATESMMRGEVKVRGSKGAGGRGREAKVTSSGSRRRRSSSGSRSTRKSAQQNTPSTTHDGQPQQSFSSPRSPPSSSVSVSASLLHVSIPGETDATGGFEAGLDEGTADGGDDGDQSRSDTAESQGVDLAGDGNGGSGNGGGGVSPQNDAAARQQQHQQQQQRQQRQQPQQHQQRQRQQREQQQRQQLLSPAESVGFEAGFEAGTPLADEQADERRQRGAVGNSALSPAESVAFEVSSPHLQQQQNPHGAAASNALLSPTESVGFDVFTPSPAKGRPLASSGGEAMLSPTDSTGFETPARAPVRGEEMGGSLGGGGVQYMEGIQEGDGETHASEAMVVWHTLRDVKDALMDVYSVHNPEKATTDSISTILTHFDGVSPGRSYDDLFEQLFKKYKIDDAPPTFNMGPVRGAVGDQADTGRDGSGGEGDGEEPVGRGRRDSLSVVADLGAYITHHAHKISSEDDARLHMIFHHSDRDGDGRINVRELLIALRHDITLASLLHLPAHIRQEDGTREAFEEVFQAMDEDDERGITFEQFRNHVMQWEFSYSTCVKVDTRFSLPV